MNLEEKYTILRNAQIVHNKSLNELEYLAKKAIIINNNGKIVAIEEDKEENLGKYLINAEIINLKNENVVLPGLIDTHVHAP